MIAAIVIHSCRRRRRRTRGGPQIRSSPQRLQDRKAATRQIPTRRAPGSQTLLGKARVQSSIRQRLASDNRKPGTQREVPVVKPSIANARPEVVFRFGLRKDAHQSPIRFKVRTEVHFG